MINKPKNLSINYYELILTENCNLRCKYCFDDAFSDRTICNYNYTMQLDMIDDILLFIKETCSESPSISFFGGEPTMNWEFIKKFVEKSLNNKFKYTMNSNLLLLNSDMIEFMLKHKIYPIISLDGTRKSHDINRITQNNTGSWDQTMKIFPELISKFKYIGIIPTVLMVVSNNNYQYLEESYEFLISLGVNVNILYNFNVEYTDEAYTSIEKQLTSLFKIKKLPPYVDAINRILNNNFYMQQNFCHKPNSVTTIAPNGKLFFCHQLVPKMKDFDDNYNEFYGDIYTGYYNNEYYSKLTERVNIDKFKINKICETCPAVDWCKGGCLAAMRINSGNYNIISPVLCKINLILNKIFRT